MNRIEKVAPVTRTEASISAKLAGVGVAAVSIADQFFSPRMAVNRDVSLHSQYDECERTGRLDNFRIAIGEKQGTIRHLAPDSDVYKWMEAAAWSLGTHPDPALEAKLDTVIDLVRRTQDASGYLCTAYPADKAAERYTNLVRSHELYCGGHLIQAAIAHHRTTGKRTFLDVAVRWADHVCDTFNEAHPDTDGHPEVEMALVELFRETGERRYLEQCEFFINVRGTQVTGGQHQQKHAPVRDQKTAVGHAVRQFYLCSGVADLYAETGESALLEALQSQWSDLIDRKIHVTGGAGIFRKGEGLGEPYELPNRTAYDETCAAIALAGWAWRMLQITGESRFADQMEQSLYNGALSGVGLAGDTYFYTNMLEHDGGRAIDGDDRGACVRTRSHWDHVACCPPNIARTLASLGGYVYGTAGNNALFVHLYVAGMLEIDLVGQTLRIEQRHGYPWDGQIELLINPAKPGVSFDLNLRIPAWAKGTSVSVNGQTPQAIRAGTYLTLSRSWSPRDRITLDLPMPIRRLLAHRRVSDNAGCVAAARGPLIYCLEQADHDQRDIYELILPDEAVLLPRRMDGPLGHAVFLTATAQRRAVGDALYSEMTATMSKNAEPAELTLIPYCLWANRSPGAMRVWIPRL